jgi:hypothetical protein
MTFEEKRKLSAHMASLPGEKLVAVLDIISEGEVRVLCAVEGSGLGGLPDAGTDRLSGFVGTGEMLVAVLDIISEGEVRVLTGAADRLTDRQTYERVWAPSWLCVCVSRAS